MQGSSIRTALLTHTLSPAAGGLAQSVPNLVQHLTDSRRCDVHVIGVEDLSSPDAAMAWGPKVHVHQTTGPSKFGFAQGYARTIMSVRPDVIDVQGLWAYPALACLRHYKKTGTPYVVTPRGMLDPWARERSWWKKRAVRAWFQDSHLFQAACLRATSEMEAEHFRDAGLRKPIAIVANGVEVPRSLPARIEQDRKRLLFLSRIHPKKGIITLLRAWAAIEAAHPDWDLIIAGPDELDHTFEMQNLARRLGVQRVKWPGAVYGEAKSVLYRSADCFVLPTHAENFGLVVAEALAHGVPVITTRNAPWEGLRLNQCGWWIELDETILRQTLEHSFSLPQTQLRAMGVQGRAWMERDFNWCDIADRMIDVYQWIHFGQSAPDCVEF